MTALRLVKREFGSGRTWYSLVRLDDDRVAMGGLHSLAEAEAWAVEFDHTIVNRPMKSGGAGVPASAPSGPSSAGVAPRRVGPAPSPVEASAGPAEFHGSLAGRAPAGRPTKEEAVCCLARALPDGRPVIGFCSPECERRPVRKSA